jgi:ribonuclease Z
MENLLQFDLEPKPALRKPEQQLFDHSNPDSPANQAVQNLSEYLTDVDDAKRLISEMPKTSDISGGDVEITTLGTGSSLPSKYRTVSGIVIILDTEWLHFSSNECYI